LNVLDFGCGVKFTQALIQYGIEVKAFVGMDVHSGLITCLSERVARPNFRFYTVPFQNAMYNKTGVPLTADSELPGEVKAYDLITLQSVFTHFAPADFLALLHVLRRYAANDARMLFTCFIDNEMESDFLDKIPDKPLLNAFYKERFIREMLAESGWRVLSLHPPGNWMMDHFVCAPAPA
jgi:SAM-dependent methyltransferase